MDKSTQWHHLIYMLTKILIIEEEGDFDRATNYRSPNMYLQIYEARRPAAAVAKMIFDSGESCNSVGHHYIALTHPLALINYSCHCK